MTNENGVERGKGEEALPLFEKRSGKGSRIGFVFSASTIFIGIIMIWVYRLIYIPKTGEPGRWIWIALFISEIFFSFYWFCTQAVRFNVVNMFPFKNRLSLRSAPIFFFFLQGWENLGIWIFDCFNDNVLQVRGKIAGSGYFCVYS